MEIGMGWDSRSGNRTTSTPSRLRLRKTVTVHNLIIPHAPCSVPRQTLSFLMRRFKEAGIQQSTKFGQDYLVELNLLQVLFEAAAVGGNDVVLEVGTGTGSLTAMLAQRAAAVVTVEDDPQMFQLAGEELHGYRKRRHAPLRRFEEQKSSAAGVVRGGSRPR